MNRGARVVPVPPPTFYALGLVVGTLASRALGVRWPTDHLSAIVGWVLLIAGVALAAGGVAGVVRHRTTIIPHRPVSALVTGGVYRWSRNPMYTGLAIAYLGGSLLLHAPVALALWPVVVGLIRILVIGPEEAYLSATFAEAYAEYRAHTRRWL